MNMTEKNNLRIGQQVVNDMLKNIEIEIKYNPLTNGFQTCVSCTELFNMTDKEFRKRYLVKD